MPSHLTRQVFRRILANEPIIHPGCLGRPQHNGPIRQRGLAEHRHQMVKINGIRTVQRRTVFNLVSLFGKKREAAGASIDPGIEKMMDLEKMTRLRARLPPSQQISEALGSYFRWARKRTTCVLRDTQAALAAQSFDYCFQSEDGAKTLLVSRTLLLNAARTLRSVRSQDIASSHAALGKSLWNIARLKFPNDTLLIDQTFLAHVRSLSLGGSPQEALAIAVGHGSKSDAAGDQLRANGPGGELGPSEETDEFVQDEEGANSQESSDVVAAALLFALDGFVTFGPDEQVMPTLRMLEIRKFESATIAHLMQQFSLRQDDFQSALRWWEEERRLRKSPHPRGCIKIPHREQEILARQTRKLLNWCLTHGEIESGHRIVEELAASTPAKPDWDVILAWAASTRRSVDEIDRMIGVMVRSNDSNEPPSEHVLPDVATINVLVETAIERDDPYTAERFVALGRDRGIEPDARTYVLQMSYRLQVGDVDGALIAYKNLQGMDVSSEEDVPTVNRLIVALCNTQRHDFDTIMNVAADLSDRRARFEPETVATLSLLHLRRDERYDVIDLLNTHAYHFSSAERESIRNALLAFALDADTPTARSWDTYTILRELFDEMPRTQRTELMTAFIRRERADMAVHIFQNMRMHSREDTMPTIDTYVAAFMSLAKLRDLENLEVVHNQLKLDFNIQTSTYLLNALIIAYTACDKARLALDYWDEIAISREGPSYNSVHVALRACEKAAFGDLKAQEIWSILRKRGVELDQSLWASYVAALAGNGDNEMAFRALEEGIEKNEVVVDDFLLGSLMAAAANKAKQEEMEGWARTTSPGVLESLERRGVETNLVGMRYFDIDRSVAP